MGERNGYKYTKIPMKAFRKFLTKPYSDSDAFVDFMADFQTEQVRSINSYKSKWGWESRSKVHRRLQEFKYEAEQFKNSWNSETLNETLNETLISPKISIKSSVSETPFETPNETHENKPLEKKLKRITPRDSKSYKSDTVLLKGNREHIPDGTTVLESPKDVLGHPTRSDGILFDEVKIDRVIKKDGKLKRHLHFHNGKDHIYLLNIEDAKTAYDYYYHLQKKQQPINLLSTVSNLANNKRIDIKASNDTF
ncbi:hypothetical protein [Sulfurimonas marina]|uniref:Uncharacterized protein n=1 Tax=Sulfurimonas marina TaxID=2590551 RepID=A0A7M1AZ31_9BACT|nr:hypothetical protein [Sulfurimonas marina]QOP41808.1 hypothetical protein FJR03_08700 [Sulfurimonas marina]